MSTALEDKVVTLSRDGDRDIRIRSVPCSHICKIGLGNYVDDVNKLKWVVSVSYTHLTLPTILLV